MEIIVNDFSLNGQFESSDDFADYMTKQLVPVLDMVMEKQIAIFANREFYSCMITKDVSLYELLVQTGDPVLSVIRGYIINLACNPPYWDDDSVSQMDAKYQYPVKAEEPNCFTEAIERKDSMLSFPMPEFEKETFECRKNNEIIKIHNITTVLAFLNVFLLDDIRNIRYVMEKYPNYPQKMNVSFATAGNKCYAEEALLSNELNMSDMQNILVSLPRMMDGMLRGEKNDYWDNLGDGIFEFRTRVSGSRIFRLLFFQRKGIVFLNGFIKKTQKTPTSEIRKAIEIRNAI
jgi:phage-related protein